MEDAPVIYQQGGQPYHAGAPLIYSHDGQPLAPSGNVSKRKSSIEFTFGDPEPIADILSNLEIFPDWDGEYLQPPIDFDGIAKMWRCSATMESATYLRRNAIVMGFKPNPYISYDTMERLVLDYEISGNFFLQQILNRGGSLSRLQHVNFRVMRRALKPNNYVMLQPWADDNRHFDEGEILHGLEYGPESDVYGIFEWVGLLNSIWLSEESILFRRKFYRNGAHLGYIFYVEDTDLSEEDEKMIQEKLTQSKGAGNFRTMFYNNRSGKSGDKSAKIQIIPVGDIGSKDEYSRIQTIHESHVFRSRRVFPHGMGGVPKDTQVGDPEKGYQIFTRLEVMAKQRDISETLNPHLPPNGQVEWHNEPLFPTAV